MASEGVDYTTDQYPGAAVLKAAGKEFACRYGGPGGEWKQLTAREAGELVAAGISLVANAEGTEDGLLGGWSVGVDWARLALADFTALGKPIDRPIYLSADFNTNELTDAQWRALDAALDGAASVLQRKNTGVYGGYKTIDHFVRNGKATWFWQTYAWSAGRVHPSAHIYQYRNKATVGGKSVDLDRSLVNDFGQWGVSNVADDTWDVPDGKAAKTRTRSIIRMIDPNPVGDDLKPEPNELARAINGIKDSLGKSGAAITDLQESMLKVQASLDELNRKFDEAGAAGDYEVTGDLHLVKKDTP